MTSIIRQPDTVEKLQILSADAKYDLACACGSTKDEHRKRSPDGGWIYPVTLADGGRGSIFKVLLSNVCTNDCLYCPLREDQDIRRCTLRTEETVNIFLNYLNQKKVFGIFLSSGVSGSPDAAMERINAVARVLRYRHKFRGYIHLKVIPGASRSAIDEAVSLASAVSLNIETPGAQNLSKLSAKKDFLRDIVDPIKYISQITAKGERFDNVHQTTQFIVGAADETDRQIVRYMEGLYDRLHMRRIYFSAYQPVGSQIAQAPAESVDRLNREHRLYQVDFLMRKYGFTYGEIPFGSDEHLPLEQDPKEAWASLNPEFFPVNVNTADKFELLRVPGLGPLTVKRILRQRKTARLSGMDDIARPGKLRDKAAVYLNF